MEYVAPVTQTESLNRAWSIYQDPSEAQVARKKQRLYKKRVTFSYEETFIIPQAEDAALWWNEEELKDSRRSDISSLQFYTRCDDTYREELLLGLAIGLGELASSREVSLALADSPFRGLEKEMMGCFRERKRAVVAKMVKATSLLDSGCKGESELLALHYGKLALPAVRFAQVLAEGDALLATSSMRAV